MASNLVNVNLCYIEIELYCATRDSGTQIEDSGAWEYFSC